MYLREGKTVIPRRKNRGETCRGREGGDDFLCGERNVTIAGKGGGKYSGGKKRTSSSLTEGEKRRWEVVT